MWSNPQFPADLVKFTEEILNENFIFCAALYLLLWRCDTNQIVVKFSWQQSILSHLEKVYLLAPQP